MSTRRNFLAYTTGAAAACTVLPAAGASEAAHPDADLLAACAAFDALERTYVASYVDYPDDGPEWDAAEEERDWLSDAQGPLVDVICELRAFTREGQVARARSLALWDAELMKPDSPHYTNERLVQAIVRDLIEG